MFTLVVSGVIGAVMVGTPHVATAVAWRWPIYCFFNKGKADLTDRCRQVIRESVDSWHREQEGRQYKSDAIDPKDPYAPPYKARLRVLGYAPDAASPVLADRLSVRRAAGVAAELEQLGIPNDLITVIGLGNKIRFPPRDGSAGDPMDPQSRLVQIVFY
jgi:hypothetical protein